MVGSGKLRVALGGVAAALALSVPAVFPAAEGQARVPAMPDGQYVAVYDIYFGGLYAGKLDIDANVGAQNYRADMNFTTKGLVGMFVDHDYKAKITGTVSADGLTPKHFSAESGNGKDARKIEIAYAGDGPTKVQVDPPYKKKPWSITPAEQAGTADPLTAALAALGPLPRGEVCNHTTEVFDGRYRFALETGPAEAKGDKLVCDGAYVRLAGFKPKFHGDKARTPFTLYFAKRDDGLYEAVKAVHEMTFGSTVIVKRN